MLIAAPAHFGCARLEGSKAVTRIDILGLQDDGRRFVLVR